METTCERCAMRAPAGAKYCGGCARALDPQAEAAAVLDELAAGKRKRVEPPRRNPGFYVAMAAIFTLSFGGPLLLWAAFKPAAPVVASPMAPTVRPNAPERVAPTPAEVMADSERRHRSKTPDERVAAVRACFLASQCLQAQLDGIVAAGASDRERVVLGRLRAAWRAYADAQRATDGAKPDPFLIAAIASSIERCGISDLRKLPLSSPGEAFKDIGSERGKVLRVSGRVLQIQREGLVYWGTMADWSTGVYFVAVGETRGVIAGSYAELVGVAVQRFTYPNTFGNLTESLVVVGRFDGQSDSDLAPLPPLPRPQARPPFAPPRAAQKGAPSAAPVALPIVAPAERPSSIPPPADPPEPAPVAPMQETPF